MVSSPPQASPGIYSSLKGNTTGMTKTRGPQSTSRPGSPSKINLQRSKKSCALFSSVLGTTRLNTFAPLENPGTVAIEEGEALLVGLEDKTSKMSAFLAGRAAAAGGKAEGGGMAEICGR